MRMRPSHSAKHNPDKLPPGTPDDIDFKQGLLAPHSRLLPFPFEVSSARGPSASIRPEDGTHSRLICGTSLARCRFPRGVLEVMARGSPDRFQFGLLTNQIRRAGSPSLLPGPLVFRSGFRFVAYLKGERGLQENLPVRRVRAASCRGQTSRGPPAACLSPAAAPETLG